MRIVGKFFIPVAFLVIVVAAFYNTGCNTTPADITVNIGEEALKELSGYNLFKGNMADLTPNGRLLPYTLITPLFSDYAEKARFVWVPEGKQGQYTTDGALQLPVGSVLVKNFYYPHDFRNPEKGRRIMETRLLIHRETGWDAETYVWNEAQTEATREIVGAQIPMAFIDNEGKKVSFDYVVPNKNQCISCHELDGKITPIGPKARNLNCDYTYTEGASNQLKKWESVGFLAGLQANVPKLAKWDDEKAGTLDERARGWLDVNCAHCHNPRGPARNAGLNLLFENRDSTSFGINKYPIAAGAGAGDNMIDIDPGHPDNSILVYRLESLNAEVMMPELGRTMVHKEGVKLIRDWVTSLKPATPTQPSP